MPIRFPAFEGSIYERLILSRGFNMYEEDYVNNVQATGTNEWSIEVSSERVDWVHYDVEIGINNGRVTFSDCSCPYNYGPVCKHVVAALYYIRDNDLYVEGGMEEEGGDDEEDDEEEEEEEENAMIPRRNQRNSNNSSKSKSKRNSASNNSMDLLDLGNEAFLDTDDVEKEFYCQVCLGIMSQPVSMPCHSHSVCYDCTMLLYKHQKSESNGYKLISCPTCRDGSGALKIKKPTDIKLNLELKRIKEAYSKKKRAWMKEKQTLEEILGLINKDGDKKNGEKEEKKSENNALNTDMMVEEEIEKMDLGRLGEIAVKVLERLHANGLTGGPVLEKYKEYFEENAIKENLMKPIKIVKKVKEAKEDAKGKEKSGFKREREVKSDEEATIGRRYSLRNKKVKK